MSTAAATMDSYLTRWRSNGDQRLVFLECYSIMTSSVRTAIANGRFHDGAWVATLIEHFATYYFRTLDDVAAAPEPWRLAHDAAQQRNAHALQLLLAGVNAHINYDLVQTVVDTLEHEWVSHSSVARQRRHDDYSTINTIIGETVDEVQDNVVEAHCAWMDIVDDVFGRLDEFAAARLLSGWRTRVWSQAAHILDYPEQRIASTKKIDRQCARRARLILSL